MPTSRSFHTALLAAAVYCGLPFAADTDIRFNSLGFHPSIGVKRATIATQCTGFTLVRQGGTTVLTDTVSGPFRNPDTEEQLYIADFTSVTEPGVYTLDVPGVGRSPEFRIGEDVYSEPFRTVMLGMYLWRCGTAVSATYGGTTFRHDACHLNDGYLDYITGTHTKQNSTRGWHDAGDYNKYVVNAGVTVGWMFKAWEHFGAAIDRLTLDIPEKNGPLPDFLAEMKWEIDWLLTMQFADGRVSHKLSAPGFCGFILPEEELDARYFVPWGSAATAGFTAMTAMASRIFRPYDAAYADRCLRAAQLGYSFLAANPADHAPDQTGFATGGYATGDPDDRLWAAAELWETTGDTAVLADFETRAAAFGGKIDRDLQWGNVKNLGMITYLLSKRTGRDAALTETVRSALVSTADALVGYRDAHGYARPMGTSYYWGCNGTVAGHTLMLQAANMVSPDPKYPAAALDAVGYLFGRNWNARSYVTGLGRNPPLNPHDRRSGADNITPPWPGYLVGGPHPSPKDWVDSQNDYRTNEIAINWNGALIYALAGFLPGSEQVPVAEVKKKPGRQGAGCGSGRFVLSDTHAGVAGTGMCDLRGRLHTRRTTGRGSAGGVRLIVRMPDGQ